jgi:hypothetical protein
MKLDNEQDRQVLLGLIQNSQISGAAVMVVADLVTRIQSAEVEGSAPATPPASTQAAKPAQGS